ncbi:integrase family protein [Dethiobacter alkaliphilus AHT 1]|uniref:Integrase family protein n=2 Tax=Dethiobacter TaxID=427925 RepID=C0GE84_DETAL|nr:integrase family protein [Dethiobacter alkaliphilus AHT 1]
MLFLDTIEQFQQYMNDIERSPVTIALYLRDLRYFGSYMEKKHNGPVYLEDIKSADIEGFLRSLKERNIAPNSRSRYLYTLRSFYKFAYKKELVERDISLAVDLVKLPTKERHYLSQQEVAELADTITNDLVRLIVIFLANTGLRISECIKLTMDDVDLDKGIIHVISGKGNKDRNVPINNKLLPLLIDYKDNWRDAYNSNFFFATKKTGTISNTYVNNTLRQAVQSLGWKKNVSCHILRHSFATSLVKQKVGLVEIQKLLGHSDLKITSVYMHADLEQLQDAVNAL